MDSSPPHQLSQQERATIDEAFATMADDRNLQVESVEFAEEAVPAGWEALRIAEA